MSFLIFGPQNVGSKRHKAWKNLLTAMEIVCNGLRSEFTSRKLR